MDRVLGGVALIAGGSAWIVAALIAAADRYGDTAVLRVLRPNEPLSSTFRPFQENVLLILGVGALAIVLGLALLYARPLWAAGGGGKAAVVLLALGLLFVAPWPVLLVGFFSWILGMVALGISAKRCGLLPSSAAISLIAAAVLFFFFNTEDDRVLLLIAPAAVFVWLGLRALMERRLAPAHG